MGGGGSAPARGGGGVEDAAVGAQSSSSSSNASIFCTEGFLEDFSINRNRVSRGPRRSSVPPRQSGQRDGERDNEEDKEEREYSRRRAAHVTHTPHYPGTAEASEDERVLRRIATLGAQRIHDIQLLEQRIAAAKAEMVHHPYVRE
eukprot:GHVU01167840.1.p1 GENE.GHVU01167840.1~~GHVU01167840.1.p1  ORF type:complete len:146 (+),score=32.67 GHVU01167840.1:245-682(+)